MSVPVIDPIEIRILGSLLEKQQTTPEYYPLTVNALAAACSQKTNREPVLTLGETEIERALARLQDDKLVWRVVGGRVVRWEHNIDRVLGLDPPQKAVMTLLMLRGPQTPGELRSRSERMHRFAAVEEVEAVLQALASRSEALAVELPRRPGQKESRWMQLLGGPATADLAAEPEERTESLAARVERLEEAVGKLTDELARLREMLGG